MKKNNFMSSGSKREWHLTGRLIPGALLLGMVATALLGLPAPSRAASIAVGISVGIAPPAIPVYTQPVCPAPGYLWTPGYWNYDPARGYFWVPGAWVMPPAAGLLWTPGYWGWSGAAFVFHAGYWGPHVGFYGGINYGFGYPGVGFVGGEWRGGAFFYNRAVVHLGPGHFGNVYYHAVPMNRVASRVSYNGGRGGIVARPTAGELAAEHDRHIEATSVQRNHEMAAHNDRTQYASANHGRPGAMASSRPGNFHSASPSSAHPENRAASHSAMTARSNSPQAHNSGNRSTARGSEQGHSNSSHGSSSNHPSASKSSHSGSETHKGGKGGR